MGERFEYEGSTVTVYQPDGGSVDVVYIISHGDKDEAAEKVCALGAAVVVIQCRDWFGDLSPWPAPGVYNDAGDFSGSAPAFLARLRGGVMPMAEARLAVRPMRRCLAGYSMAGLFALWAAYNAPEFELFCCASGAVWYEGWLDFMQAGRPLSPSPRFYLSVGNREKKTRNVRMSRVVKNTELSAQILSGQGYPLKYELNEGGHFSDPTGRLVKGIKWLLEEGRPD